MYVNVKERLEPLGIFHMVSRGVQGIVGNWGGKSLSAEQDRTKGGQPSARFSSDFALIF